MARQQINAVDVEYLEKMIDAYGNAQIADALARIAHEKAEHVSHNWQDQTLARTWKRVARRYEKQIPGLELADDLLGFGEVR